MLSLDFDWQTNEFMLYCRATRLREKKQYGEWCLV